MNYFGLFFSFMIPGILIGWMCAYCIKAGSLKKLQNGRREHQKPVDKQKLYICTLSHEDWGSAA